MEEEKPSKKRKIEDTEEDKQTNTTKASLPLKVPNLLEFIPEARPYYDRSVKEVLSLNLEDTEIDASVSRLHEHKAVASYLLSKVRETSIFSSGTSDALAEECMKLKQFELEHKELLAKYPTF